MKSIAALAFLASVVLLKADQVMFSNGATRIYEKVSLDAQGHFAIDGKTYSPKQVLQWITDHPATVGPAHEVLLKDGSLYLGKLLAADRDSLTLRIEPMGKPLVISRKRIREIVFSRRVDRLLPADFPKTSNSGILIRKGGGPVPCQLEGIFAEKIVFSTQLGKTALPSHSLLSYVISHGYESPEARSAQMEIGLTDGSVFHGQVSGGMDKVTIRTSDLPVFSVPKNAIRYVRTHAFGEWLPIWTSGKATQDWLGKKEKEYCCCALLLSTGESVRMPAPSDGVLYLHAKRFSGSSAKLVVSRNGKDVIGIELKGNWIKKVFSIGEGSKISFRMESPEAGASAMIGDLVILKNRQG